MKALVVDYANGVISLSSAFEKKAFTPGTTEYAQLMAVRNDFPGFRLATRKFKTNTKQDRYKGLTYDYMRWYITKVETKENAPAVLAGFEALLDMSKCHSTGRRYKEVKTWFFERYPDVKKFGMTEEELAKFEKEEAEKKQEESKAQETNTPAADANSNKVTDFRSPDQVETEPGKKSA